jgi:hypothetical protein
MAEHPDGGMYSIKLIHPRHLDHALFASDIHGDGKQRWMNFSENARSLAQSIQEGHRALVYVTGSKKFVWAIEYMGPVQDGGRVVAENPSRANNLSAEWSTVFLPIRYLATVDMDAAEDAQDVLRRADVEFTPNAFAMKYISAADYRRIFDAVRWEEKSL